VVQTQGAGFSDAAACIRRLPDAEVQDGPHPVGIGERTIDCRLVRPAGYRRSQSKLSRNVLP